MRIGDRWQRHYFSAGGPALLLARDSPRLVFRKIQTPRIAIQSASRFLFRRNDLKLLRFHYRGM